MFYKSAQFKKKSTLSGVTSMIFFDDRVTISHFIVLICRTMGVW